MANATRVRVELKPNQQCNAETFRRMFTAFKKQCDAVGVKHTYKEHEHFESRSRKLRRKRRESENYRLKQKLRENFSR